METLQHFDLIFIDQSDSKRWFDLTLHLTRPFYDLSWRDRNPPTLVPTLEGTVEMYGDSNRKRFSRTLFPLEMKI